MRVNLTYLMSRSLESTGANFSLKSQALSMILCRYCQVDRTSCTAACTQFGYACSICSYAQLRLASRAYTRILQRLSCTARLSSSKAGVVSTRREYSRTTHRINKIYPWTTHVRLSYFKNLPPRSARRSPSAPAAASTVISALRRTDFKGPRPVKKSPTATGSSLALPSCVPKKRLLMSVRREYFVSRDARYEIAWRNGGSMMYTCTCVAENAKTRASRSFFPRDSMLLHVK